MVSYMQIWTKSTHAPINIAVLLYPRFSNLCLANCLEPLRAANGFAGRDVYRWRFLSPEGSPPRSSSGLLVQPDGALGEISECDYLFVLSSYDQVAHDTTAHRQALRRAAGKAANVVGFDTGAWLMAAAGLLRGRRATVHWDLLEPFEERFLDTTALRESWVADGPMITCAGAMAAFELTRAMVREHLGASMAVDVDGLFLTDRPQSAPQPQPEPRRADPLVRRALALMRANLETPLSMTALARALNTGPRTLARRFEDTLGKSPGAVYRHLRLSAAHQMVINGTLGISEIALRCGYENPAAMTRAFRSRFGAPPRALRREIAQSGP